MSLVTRPIDTGEHFPTRSRAGLALALALAACAACAPRARAESAPAPSPDPSSSPTEPAKPGEKGVEAAPGSSTSPAAAAPLTQQRVARALDPAPGSDPCGGYAFDGVALGMTQKALEPSLPLAPLKPEEGLIEGFQGRTFGFRAARPGRIDDVQVGFTTGSPPVVAYVLAQVLVAEHDAWPSTLFDRLGSPKNARMGEWIWWDLSCGVTLRLTKVEPLDAGSGRSYTLELRHTLKPAE